MKLNDGVVNQTYRVVAIENLEAAIAEQLELVHKGMYEKAKKNLDAHIYAAYSLEEARKLQ